MGRLLADLRRWIMRHLAAAMRLVAWAVVASLGLLAITRVVAWDAQVPPLLGLHGLGPIPYLLALPIAVAALALRRIGLGLVGLAVTAAMVPTGLPEASEGQVRPRHHGRSLP